MRGAVIEAFATEQIKDNEQAPIYIYDRLDEITATFSPCAFA